MLMLASAASGCSYDLEPHGEALVVVDTDAPLKLVERLRVDVFSEDGHWLESRDLPTADAKDWPVSFSVVSPSDTQSARALVRLRAYSSGRLRDYLGERYQPRPDWQPLVAPRTTGQMCAEPDIIAPGDVVTLRLGGRAFHPVQEACRPPGANAIVWAANAVAIDFPEPGRYRVAVIESVPNSSPSAPLSLEVQPDCEPSEPNICAEFDIENPNTPPSLVVDVMQAGLHHVIVSGPAEGVTEAIVGVSIDDDDAWNAVLAKVPDERRDVVEVEAPGPLPLESGDPPAREPLPTTTIDRLVLVDLEPSVVGSAHVTLHFACFGAMAKLRDESPHQPPQLDQAASCTRIEGQLDPVSVQQLSPGMEVGEAQWLGSFPAPQGCDQPDTADSVCVPGGTFLLGDRDLPGNGHAALSPERVVAMQRFWIDRREVTVARWRHAKELGFDREAGANSHVDAPDIPDEDLLEEWKQTPGCTFSEEPWLFEDFPLNCVTWHDARAFCHFVGGELPSAAQWEYVATAAARSAETAFPWGDAEPRCSIEECNDALGCHAAMIADTGVDASGCDSHFPQEFEDTAHGDASWTLNDDPSSVILGLAGSLHEYTLDALEPYDGACWGATTLLDPVCFEQDAPSREVRGGSWAVGGPSAFGATRSSSSNLMTGVGEPGSHLGFRCVYREAP